VDKEVPAVRWITQYDFFNLLRRTHLSITTKAVAFNMASYASPDGTRIYPGDQKIADELDLTERAVREHTAVLRGLGLLTRVRHHGLRTAGEYRLSWPKDPDFVPMRLDPDGNRLIPKAEPKPRPRKQRNPGAAALPVDNSEHRNPSSGDLEASEPNLLTGQRNPGAGLPEPGFRSSGTPVPPTIHTNHYQPTTSVVSLDEPLTNGPVDNFEDQKRSVIPNQPARAPTTPPDPAAYATAHAALARLPDYGIELSAAARRALAAEGQPDPSPTAVIIRAATLITTEA
jgi:hypothetical protein